jgi:hypothetical protein
MQGVFSSGRTSPIHHQFSSSSSEGSKKAADKDIPPPVSDDFLANLLEQKGVADKLKTLEGLKFGENENTKLNLSDELFHVKAPDGTRFKVAGQRSLDNPSHIHVRIPHTEELTGFTLVQGDRDADWEFIYTLPEYRFSSDNQLMPGSSREAQHLDSKDYGAFFDEDAYYSQPISQKKLMEVLPPQEPKEAPKTNQFDFPRRELIPSDSMKSGVEAPSHAEQNAIADQSEVLEKLERLDIQGARHFARGLRKQEPLGGVSARQASPTPSLSKVEVDLGRYFSDSDSESSDSDDGKSGPTTYTPAALALLKEYGIAFNEDGSAKLPGTKFVEYTNPRETNRFTDQVPGTLLGQLGVSAGTVQSASRNPLLNLPRSFAELNEKLFKQSKIRIVSAGSGLTPLGIALHGVFEPNGDRKQRQQPLDGSEYTQPTYEITFIDPAGKFGGLAYQVGMGCLGGAASGATKTNTPVSHLQLAVLGLSFRDFLKEKIETLKAAEKEKTKADVGLENSKKSMFRAFPRLGKMAHSVADRIRRAADPSDLEKAETLMRLNFDSGKGKTVDRFRAQYRYRPDFKFFQASAKDKANSRKFWEGQGEREFVCEYGDWIIKKMRNAGITMNFVKGKVTACEVDAAPNVHYTYTEYDENGSERKTTIEGDVGIIGIGQGPLKTPPQVKHLPKESILTYDELVPDAQKVVDLIANNPGPVADEAVRAYGEKWLGLKLGILGTGIAFEEVEPVLEIMTKICRQYEKERDNKLLPDREMDFFKNGSIAFSRNGLTHELKREDTFFLRFGFSPEKDGKSTALFLEKVMTEKEVEYRKRLGEIFKEGQTVDVVTEFQKSVDEIKNTPTRTRKEKALLDACLTFALHKTGNAIAAGLDDMVGAEREVEYQRLHAIFEEGKTVDVIDKEFRKIVDEIKTAAGADNIMTTEKEAEYRRKLGKVFEEGKTAELVRDFQVIVSEIQYAAKIEPHAFHPWRKDIHECLLLLNNIFRSYLEKSIVPTSNANVDRTDLMRERGRIIAAGTDYRLSVGKDKKIVLKHQDGEVKGLDKIVICGGRENYDRTGRGGGIKFPDTKTLGSKEDPSLQSMDVEAGYFPNTPDGKVLPFIIATPAWMPLAALTGSNSLFGAKGALAAYASSAKASLGRAAESGGVLGALINFKLNDETSKLTAAREPGDEREPDIREIDSDEFESLVEEADFKLSP